MHSKLDMMNYIYTVESIQWSIHNEQRRTTHSVLHTVNYTLVDYTRWTTHGRLQTVDYMVDDIVK